MLLIKSISKRLSKILVVVLVFISTIALILNSHAPKITLLGFHTVVDPTKPVDHQFQVAGFKQMNYFQPDMEILLDYLVSHNFWFVSAQELYDYFINDSKEIPAEHLGQKPIMLSFDDGYKNVYTNLLPILQNLEEKYGRKVKVVLFVNPGTLADYESPASFHMTCKDLRFGLEQGFYDIQSHGLKHKNLTKIKTEDLINELAKAQTELRKCTEGLDPNKTVASHLAYPYGATNEKVRSYASKYYLSGYLYNSLIMKIGWLKSDYQIPRFTVNWKQDPHWLSEMAEKSSRLKK